MKTTKRKAMDDGPDGKGGNTAELWGGRSGGLQFRVAGAAAATVLLLVFLVVARWFGSGRVPDQTIREMDTAEVAALPAPPPPPAETPPETPPPPPPPKLPRLDVEIDNTAPPIKASLEREVRLTMRTADFEWETDPVAAPSRPKVETTRPPQRVIPTRPPNVPKPKSVYSEGELDAKPRLLNKPTSRFPTALLRKGVREGRVLLEVSLSTSGRVTVRRVLAASHPDFAAMARSVASKARFTVPRKNGRPVTAIYKWPLILRP